LVLPSLTLGILGAGYGRMSARYMLMLQQNLSALPAMGGRGFRSCFAREPNAAVDQRMIARHRNFMASWWKACSAGRASAI
jgi:hypothetical protein